MSTNAQVILACVLLGAGATPQPACQAQSPSSPASVALGSLGLDSLCIKRCGVVLIDPIVRAARELVAIHPNDAKERFRLARSEVRILERGGRQVALGEFPARCPLADTVAIALHLAERSKIPGDRVFGVAIGAPGNNLLMWYVALDREGRIWKVRDVVQYIPN